MFRKRKVVTFKQVFWYSVLLATIYLLFQKPHWLNITGTLFVVLILIPTIYYFSNDHSFKAISYKNKDHFNGVTGFFVLLTVTAMILITVLISVFGPNLL
ncbi:hypothetical protein C7K38_09630 [Tetragenococcus osmophilus]|uniref:Uncharacterized protein n=1 Tax=Tetragenococcus osmophilus TaxID=526944 RepID=A0AA37XL05_9ENTE|nr:hypothetical protein [Tetragenococcus osmophilus]AYW48605.1 hypothetical protein C7K38_09630 [Tetragenococcus osmophilus]GMA54522.1 hypothetical protein GCM10025857_58790 [Alicyclobacillus contaminans]GMA71630.1 hypothetical protein GCM10025885_06790 [Tetragenococcus osmophilus]